MKRSSIYYKNTKCGWIPKEWECKKLNEISDKVTDGTHDTPKRDLNSNIPLYTTRNLNNGKLKEETDYYISEYDYNKISIRSKIEYNDILYGMIGTIGEPIIINIINPKFAVKNIGIIKFGLNISTSHYVYYYLLSDVHRRYLRKALYGNAQKFLGLGELRNLPISFPPLPEQKKIAKILGIWDRAIEQTEKLIEAKEKLKKGLMQQLLTGRMRFPQFGKPVKKRGGLPEGWKNEELGDLGYLYSGLVNKSKNDFGRGKKYISYKNIFNNSSIDINQMDYVQINDGEKQNEVKKGDIFFTQSSETPDEIGMSSVLLENTKKSYLNSFCFGFRIIEKSKLSFYFSKYYFRGTSFRSYVKKLAQGSTRYNLSKVQLIKGKLCVPKIIEQKEIYDVLENLSKQIVLLQNKLSIISKQKKGLMQKLLTGEIRVNE